MKLLYITPKINDEGGVQKVLSIRTNYFIEKFDYKIDILTQNYGNKNLFFDFNKKIGLYDILLTGNKISKVINYRKALKRYIHDLQPDFIIVCDFGLKAFLIPFIITTKIPIVFEVHGSLYNEPVGFKKNIIGDFFRKIKYSFRKYAARKFEYFIALSQESLQEWHNNKGFVINNPIVFNENTFNSLQNKKVITIARHSFEKGLDRLLPIWQIVAQKHPDWQLDIYGKNEPEIGLEKLAEQLEISHFVNFLEPIKNINDKYLDASIYAMTSRSEAFPMVLLEAQSFGLPIVAFDCPIGPRSIINDKIDGFLIPDGDSQLFADKLSALIQNENLRIAMGQNAKKNVEKYDIYAIMQTWNNFFADKLNP